MRDRKMGLILLFALVLLNASGQPSLFRGVEAAKGELGPTSGTDSAKQVTWEKEILRTHTDQAGNYVTSDYTRYEYRLKNYDMLVVTPCGDTTPIYSDYTVPRSCIHKIKAPPMSRMHLLVRSDQQLKKDSVIIPDSIDVNDDECVKKYYQARKDSLEIDTIQVLHEKEFDYNFRFDLVNKCSYKYNLKDGREYGYYSLKELNNICVAGNFMIKYRGEWKGGQKTGKWIEYDRSGKIVSMKKYRSGKVTKEKQYK